MTDKGLLCTGAAGSVIAAICCFTPALVILLGTVGLSAWLAWLDYILLPALFLSLGLTAFAAVRMQRSRARGVAE
ncbi:MAG: mercury resistance system transport protein MerF [Geminicoccaceae bacterium]